MIFNSTVFLLFFIIFFFIFWWLNNNYSLNVRNLFIILSSYLFYGWWDWRFLSLLFISSFADFILGLLINRKKAQSSRYYLLILSLVLNLGILGFFKYFNFFIDSLGRIINLDKSTLQIVLPVGISFYTFQSLSYTIDIYRKKIEPTYNILEFLAFVSFFPQLVAGPIERASNLLKQFRIAKEFDYNSCISGLRLALWGFFKKIVIADNFGILADKIFDPTQNYSGITILFGTVCFGFQIYADFSGYSDIAIGISRMLGFNLMTNFRTPYFSGSIGEFWQRWHISLSSWFRDYVYIPMGGNRINTIRTCFNILITFLLSGLWHGANFTFIIWGGLYGILLIIEKQLKLDRLKKLYYPFVIITVFILWIPFRAENLEILKYYVSSILNLTNYSGSELSEIINTFSLKRFVFLAGTFILFITIEYIIQIRDFDVWISTKTKTTRWVYYYLIVLLILIIGNFSVKPNFIYFQF
jgi:D-alanyl-lipoteichoic acid acyltransferase DltB (MBOAT superfamily)